MKPDANIENKGWEYFGNLKNVWSVIKAHLLEKYKDLSEDDLFYEEGNEDALLTRIENKLFKSREEVARILQDIYLSAPKGGSPK